MTMDAFVPGTLSRSLDPNQVTQLLRLFGEAGELDGGLARKRHLIRGLVRIVRAEDGSIVIDEDFRPTARGQVTSLVRTDDGLDMATLARLQPYFEVGARFDPA